MIKKDTYLLENIDYEVMFENAPVAIGFTKDRRFIKCNARFELLFGYEPDGVVGLPGSVVHLDQDDYYEFGKQVGPLLSKGATVDVDKKIHPQGRVDFRRTYLWMYAGCGKSYQRRDDVGH